MTPRSACALLVVAACGGSNKEASEPAPVVSPTPVTRVPVEEPPEEEEGVSFVSTRGRMDTQVIEAGIAPHKTALAACYTENLNKRRWLGGQVILWWDIAKDGSVTGVHLHDTEPGTNLGNWQMEKCILDVARQATFGKPSGGDADFQIPLEFAAKGALTNWDEEKSLRAIGGQTAKIDECAHPKKPPRKAADRLHAPKGPITITIYVGPGGKAQSVGFAGATVIEDAWADCAEKAALAWRLPDPRGSIAKLVVTYPR